MRTFPHPPEVSSIRRATLASVMTGRHARHAPQNAAAKLAKSNANADHLPVVPRCNHWSTANSTTSKTLARMHPSKIKREALESRHFWAASWSLRLTLFGLSGI
jgi:hypothetical protein